jgi:hypothetical protein
MRLFKRLPEFAAWVAEAALSGLGARLKVWGESWDIPAFSVNWSPKPLEADTLKSVMHQQ